LEGLEISIKLKSEAFDLFYKSRIDPEFFQEKYICLEKQVRNKQFNYLGDIAFVTDGEHGTAKTTESGYSKYFGARNVLSGILNDNNVEYISKEHHIKLGKTSLKPRDILISCVGANIGYSAIVPDNIGVGNIVRNVALIRSTSDYVNEYLHSYFLSKYGKELYYRMNSGNAQPLVSLDYIKTIAVFKPSLSFQNQIKELINKSLNSIEQSKQTYTQTENLLLEEIGLQDFEPSKEPVNIKSFADSFGTSGRLDAEYYQPKYDDYLKLIESYSNGSDTIAAICNLNGKNFKPEDKTTYNYIELSNVGKTGDINGCTVDFGKELPSRARRKVNIGDVIISSIEGSLDSCALVTKEYNNALCSTGFYVINSESINSESLLVLFKSELMQNVLKQNCSGTILTGMNKDDFLNIRIPKNKRIQATANSRTYRTKFHP
jgi:restriction endonuclease S subunit